MNTKDLKRALGQSKPFISRYSTLPILNNVALYTGDGRLWIEASNLEIFCRIPVAHAGEFAGITVEHKVLAKIAGALDCPTLDFASDNDHLVITGTGTTARLPGIDRDEFPITPRKADKIMAVMGAGVLKRVATLVAPSALTDESRPVLMQVCVELTKEGALFIASDGYMLSKLGVQANGDYAAIDDEATLLVPAKAWKAIAGLASSANEDVTLGIVLDKEGEPRQAMFSFASGAQAVAMLYNMSPFPKWQDIWPAAFTGSAVVTNLGKAIKPLLSLAGRDYLKSAWIFSDAGLHISAKGEDGASMARSVEAVVTGEPLTIHFDITRVNDLLKRKKGNWTLRYGTDFSPMVFEMGAWATAVMPMPDK